MNENDWDAADELAAGVQSFLDSFPFIAPEAMPLHLQVKLQEPLDRYNAEKRERRR